MPVVLMSCLCSPWALATSGPPALLRGLLPQSWCSPSSAPPASFQVSVKCVPTRPHLSVSISRQGCLWHVVIRPLPDSWPLEVEVGGSCLPAAVKAITHHRYLSVLNDV